MVKLYETSVRAIRKKCLDCCGHHPKEIRECILVDCALYAYRMGRRADKATIDILKKFYYENIETAGGLSPKKDIVDESV